MADAPQHLYDLDSIVPNANEVEIGVLISPDETNAQYKVPCTFTKTISYLRSFAIKGVLTINGEEVDDTAEYSYGFDPIEQLVERNRKLGGIGHVLVTMTVRETPIILLPNRDNARRVYREYYPVPLNWLDIRSAEGKDFFRRWTDWCNTPDPDLERWASPEVEALRQERKRFEIDVEASDYDFYDSNKSALENYNRITHLLRCHGQSVVDADVRKLLDLPLEEAA
jgi:hypothetical protein